MRLLGALIAGGKARRFGSDKALAELHGKPLIAHVAEALAAQCEALVVCGRAWSGLTMLPDRPASNLGPLGGINAALHHAATHGFDAVLTAGCDTPGLPGDVVARLQASGPAAYVAELPIIALWPARLAPLLDAHLTADGDRSIRGWARAAGAIGTSLPVPLPNINTPADLATLNGAEAR